MDTTKLINDIACELPDNKDEYDKRAVLKSIIDKLNNHFETHDNVLKQLLLEDGKFFCKRGREQISQRHAKDRMKQGLQDTLYIMFDYEQICNKLNLVCMQELKIQKVW